MNFGQFWNSEEERRRQLNEQRRAQENAVYPNAATLVAEIESVLDWFYDASNSTFDTATNRGIHPVKNVVTFKFAYCDPGIVRVNFMENHEKYITTYQCQDITKDDWKLLFSCDFNYYASKYHLTPRVFEILKVQANYYNPYDFVYVEFARMPNGKSYFKLHFTNLRNCNLDELRHLGCTNYLRSYEDDFENHHNELWYKLGKYDVHLSCANCYEFVREIF